MKRVDELSLKPAIAMFLLGLAQVALGRALRR